MKITVHVRTIAEAAAARTEAEETHQDGDELEIIVAQAMPVETQPARQAVGIPLR